jgi:hypothetical protein
MDDPHRDGQVLRVVRLESVLEITTCSDCWTKESVQRELEGARRTGSAPGS